jgi:hypothetical protein
MVIEAGGIALSTESSNTCNPSLTARKDAVLNPRPRCKIPRAAVDLQQNCSLETETFSRGGYPIFDTAAGVSR